MLAATVDLTNLTLLYQFKKILSRVLSDNPLDTSKNLTYVNAGNRHTNILLCQLWNSSSNLKSDLYRDHLIESTACACGIEYETVYHYFLVCRNYAESRDVLIEKSYDRDHNH